MRWLIHKLICRYLSSCAGAFHHGAYGDQGRYVVLLTEADFSTASKALNPKSKLDEDGCAKQVCAWLSAECQRTLVHLYTGQFGAFDNRLNISAEADTLPLLADAMLHPEFKNCKEVAP